MVSEPRMVKLRNGTEVAEPIVTATMINLEHFASQEPIAFYELVCVCQDPDHKPFGNTGGKLAAARLLDGGVVPSAVRDIVLSAIRGGGDTVDGSLHLGSPYAEGE